LAYDSEKEGTTMLLKMESKKTLDQVCQDLEKAVVANKFGVMSVHNLNETLAKKGVRFDRPCRIFEVCNPHQAKKVLEKNIEISSFLPCRISVFTEGDWVVLTTLKPTELITHFNAPELKTTAQEVEEALTKIMREAAA
jgi:uncharacterized protein (DUF302 family)